MRTTDGSQELHVVLRPTDVSPKWALLPSTVLPTPQCEESATLQCEPCCDFSVRVPIRNRVISSLHAPTAVLCHELNLAAPASSVPQG